MGCTVGQVIGGLISRSQGTDASILGLHKAVEHLLRLRESRRADAMGNIISGVCVSVDGIVCMHYDHTDLYLKSLRNHLCLKACDSLV